MNLVEYCRLAVSEGRTIHRQDEEVYIFTSKDGNLNLAIRVNTNPQSPALFRATFDLYNRNWIEVNRKAAVRLADGTVLARIGALERSANVVNNVASFAEKDFELTDENDRVIEMRPWSSKSITEVIPGPKVEYCRGYEVVAS